MYNSNPWYQRSTQAEHNVIHDFLYLMNIYTVWILTKMEKIPIGKKDDV